MAATSDPSDPTGGKDRRRPPVIDLSASEVGDPNAAKAREAAEEAPAAGERADDALPETTESETGAAETPEKASDAPTTGEEDAPSDRPRTSGVPATGSAALAGESAASDGAGEKKPVIHDDDDDETFPPQQITVVRRGTGVLGLIVAALIGAVVALGAAYVALTGGLVPLPQTTAGTTGGSGDSGVIGDLRARLGTLESNLEAAMKAGSATGDSGASSTGAPSGSILSEFETLKASVEELKGGLPDRVAQLESRLNDVAGAAPAVSADDVEALKTSVKAAADQASTAADQASTAAGEAGKAADVAGQASAAAQEANTAIVALKHSVETLKTAQASLQTSLGTLSGTVSDLTGSVETIEKSLGGPGPRETAALAIATAMLDDAIRSGKPFAAALAAVKERLGDPAAVAALAPYAESGLSTRQALVDQFPKVEAEIRESVRGEAVEQGFVSGLLANAESLVTIRRTGGAGDGGVGAALSAIRADLASGDLAGAETAWQALPDQAKAVSKDWHDQLAARIAADALVHKVTGEVLSSLADTQSPSGSSSEPAPAEPAPSTSGN